MSHQKFAPNLSTAHTTPEATLGELYIDEDGNHFRYMQADGAVTKDLLYTTTNGWEIDTALVTGTVTSGKVAGLCISDVTLADDEYAWVFVGPGLETLSSAAAIAADAKIYTSATAGKIDDDSSGQILIPGLVATTAFASAVTGTVRAMHEMYISN